MFFVFSFHDILIFDESSGFNAIQFGYAINDDRGNFAGVLRVVYNILDISSVVDESVKNPEDGTGSIHLGFSRKSTTSYLVTASGKLIYSTASGFGNLKDVSHMVAHADRGYHIGVENGAEKMFSHAQSSGYLGFPGLGWYMVITKDTAEVFAPLQTIAIWMLWLAILSVVIIFIITTLLASSFVRPLQIFTNQVKEVESGNLNAQIGIDSNDEIGQLAGAFNGMVKAVKTSRKEVDDKVASQTKQLQEKANELADKQTALLNVLADIDEEKNKLAAAKAQDEAILSGIGDGVFVLNTKRQIVLFNPTAQAISGYSAKEAIGQDYKKILNFIFEKDRRVNDAFVHEAMDQGVVTQMANHTLLIKKDGTEVPVADSAAPIKDANGKITGCVVVFRDVTKEREIDRMKSEFVSVASHQLRTPLTGIKWFSELLLKTKASATVKEYVKQIAASNERMVRLVDDLLNVSRIETGRKFDVIIKDEDIVPIMKSVMEEQVPIAKEKKIALSCEKNAPKKLILPVDELKVRQVFQNLINNAIKYSKENTNILIGCEQKENDVVFFFKDQGIGIPQNQQDKIFTKFFRAENVFTMHTDGTGLGLYIVKAIVEAHGGKIWFESKEGVGTTFYASFPRVTPAGLLLAKKKTV